MSEVTKFCLFVLILAVFADSCLAQQAVRSPIQGNSVTVNVLDAKGNAVRDLTKENFRIRLNGKPATVIDARYSIAPRRIVVLLDVSGSMTGEDQPGKWKIVREAMDDLLKEMPTDVSIALIAFSNKNSFGFDFPQSRAAIAKWLKEGFTIQPPKLKYARTPLFDAISAGLRVLQPTQPGDSIYAITDGFDNASQASAAKTEQTLQQSGVRLFALLFDEALNLPTSELQAKKSIADMVENSGGCVFSISGFPRGGGGGASWPSDYIYDDTSREKVRLYTKQLNILVSGFWTLEIAALTSDKRRKVRLEIVRSDGKVRKDVQLSYPRALSAAR